MTSCRLQLLFVRCCLLFALCLLPVAFTPAQSTSATLSGTVSDPNGAAVVGAQVTVTNAGTGLKRQATTSGVGAFTIPLLPPSTYTVLVENQGFTPAEIRDLVLNVNDNVSLNIELKLGQVGATVDVKSNASLIDESAAVSTVVDRQFVGNLPLNGRSFQSLITLTPGIVLTKTTGANPGQFSVNGQRANANYFTVDGVGANIDIGAVSVLNQTAAGTVPGLSAFGSTSNLVSIDALQEFKIQTSTYAPEFGRSPGAQVQILTRSGTRDFKGALFEYVRNDKLDATDWFVNANPLLRKPPLRQNDFGGVVGGPIFRKTTFFFFSYEGLRLRQPQVATVEVPSLSLRQSAVAPVQPYLNAFPIPNGPTAANGLATLSASYSNPSTLNATSLRIDHIFNQKTTFFARYNYAPSQTVSRATGNTGTLSNLIATKKDTQTLTAGVTTAFSTQVINEFRANYSRAVGRGSQSLDNFGGAVVPANSLLFPSFAAPDRSRVIFSLSYSTRPGFNVGRIADHLQRQFNLVDSVSLSQGPHQLKLGVDYRRLMPVFGPQDYLQNGIFANSAQVQSGMPAFVTISAQQSAHPLFTNFSAFVQDTWKATRRLTLTYGLRWEINPPPTEAHGNDPFTLVDLANPSTLALAPRGTPLYKTTYNNFAPRLGFTYQLREDPKRMTVVRGGFGIFYDVGNGETGNSFTSFPFMSPSKTLTGVSFPISEASAAPNPFGVAPVDVSIEVSDPNLKLPRIYQWNFGVEQSLGTNQTISASYVGAIGRRLLRRTSLRGIPSNFFQVSVTRNDATSDYHALQLQFQRSLSRGLQALVSYTWSHSIDDASDEVLGADRGRGSSDSDVRHAFSAGLTYNIPSPSANKAIKAIAGNWSIDTIIHSQSATPINLVGRAAQNINGVLTMARPNLVEGIPLYIIDPTAPGGKRFNDAVDPSRPGCKGPFCPPPVGQQGTLGRNVLLGFPVNQVDFALRRRFSLLERLKLQLKGEAFNIFNHPNFGDPNNTLTSALFGRSTTMYGRGLGAGGINGGFNPLYQLGGARSIQFSVRLEF